MAKKENLSSAKTELDNNFDDFNFDFDAPEPSDDRSPVTKLAVGALAGAKTAASQEEFIRQSIKTVLPDGYGLALDLQKEVSEKSKELYNNAVKEVKPIAGEMARAAEKLLPAGANRLKARLTNIDKWSKDTEKKYSSNNKEDNEKASIAASINETFKFQMQMGVKDSAKAEGREKLQEGLALTRHRDSFGMLNRMNVGISTLVQYQNKVNAAYQKKSLELQYRSLFTSIDILQEAKRQNAFTSQALTTITKNTGLPDFVKLSEGDRLEGVIRNKFANTIGDSILGGKENPLAMFSEHITKVFNEKLTDMVSVLSSSADLMSTVASAKEDAEGKDKFKQAGGIAGSFVPGMLRKYIAPKAKKYLPKKVVDNGSRIEGAIKNSRQSLDKFKTGNYGETDGGIKADIFKLLKDFIPNLGVSTSLEKDNVGDLTKPGIYTKQTNKSINEVIPGYLSRIFRELQVMRTGDSKIGLTVYDNQSNKFLDSKAADKNLLNSIMGSDAVDSTKDQLQGIVKLVDPENKLSAEAGIAFAKKTLKDNLANKIGTADRTAHEFTYIDDETTKLYSKEIAEVMQAYFGSNKNGKIKNNAASYDKQNAFTEKQRNLGSAIPDARGKIQNLINLGSYEELERLGLIKYSSSGEVQINLDKLIDYSTGSQYISEDEQLTPSFKNSKEVGNKTKSRAAMSGRPSTGFISKKDTQSMQQPQQVHQQSNNADLIKMLSESSVKEEMTKATGTLEKIQEILLESNVAQEAYFTNLIENVKAIGLSSGNGPASAEGKTNNGNVFQGTSVNLKNFLGKTTRGLGSLFSLGNKVSMFGLKTSSSVIGAAFSLGKSSLNVVGNALSRLGQKRELFVPGEDEPRIKTDILKAGKYFNKKGKPYKSLDDVNDTVYDEDGSIVITKEELKDSYIRSKRGSGIFKIAKFSGGLLSDAAKFGAGLIPPAFTMALNASKFVLKTAKNLLDQAEDIYIKGVEDPVMLKRTMVAGGYFLKSDMTVVKRPSQITGTIVNAEKEVVLSEEDLRSGIFDKEGRSIKSPLGRLFNYGVGALKLAGKLISSTVRTGTKVLKAGMRAGKGLLGAGAKFLGGGFGSFAKSSSASTDGISGVTNDNSQTLDVLERIFMVLDSRLPAKANRKGSWKDSEAKKGRSNRAADSVNAASKGSLGDGLLSKGRSLLEKVTGGGDSSININNSGTDNSKAPDPKDGKPKKGVWNKAKGFGKGLVTGKTGMLLGAAGMMGANALAGSSEPGSVGGAVGKAADLAGTASTIYNIARFVLPAAEVAGATLGAGATTGGIVAAGTGAAAATTAGATAVAAGGATASAGLGATLLSGLGTLAASTLAILSSPVVLGGLAIAAAAGAAYLTYQYFKKTEYLKNLRFAQYGFTEKNSSSMGQSAIDKISLLERSLKEAVYFKEGVAAIETKKFDKKNAFSLFGVNAEDNKAVSKWLYWFQERFKPVFLTHLTALRAVDNKSSISDYDDLKAQEKNKLLEMVKFQEGPYSVNVNPLSGASFSLTTSKEVNEVYQDARKGIDEELKGSKNKGSSATATQYDSKGNIVSSTEGTKTGAAEDTLKQNKLGGKDYSKDSTALKGSKGAALAISGISGDLPTVNTLELLEGIRMRAYGLTTMESDKVAAIRKLENLIISKVQYGGDGKAIYKADSVDTVVSGGMFFGVTTGSDLANSWSKWFQTRFLPVYLSYLGLVKQNTGAALKAGITPSLTALQVLGIGTQISSIDSVWSVKDSPWSSYKLGTDQGIVKELIESLRVNSKKAVMSEAVVVKDNASTSGVGNTQTKDYSLKAALNSKNTTSNAKPQGGQDAENVEMNRALVGSPESSNGTAGLALAGGPVSDGRNASAFLKIATGATLNGLNPEFLKNFNGLVDEYGTLTGNSTLVNSGFRSYEKQAALHKADPSKAAPPGGSLHESGLAIDVQSKILDDMDKRGLLRKYGFTRPVGGEPWHLEATGIQNDINGFKRNPELASKAIAAGLGKGGGGYGTMADATKYRRNQIVAKQILDATVAPSKEATATPEIPDKAQIAGTVQTPIPSSLGTASYDAMGNMTGSVDAESPIAANAEVGSKTKSEILGSAPSSRNSGASNNTNVAANSTKSSIYGSSPNAKGGVNTSGNTGNMMPVLKAATISTGAKYDTIPSPSGGKGWFNNKDMIIGAANAVGVDPKLMVAIGAIESDFNPSAKAPNTSASGLNQFVDATWKEQMQKNASKYGIPANASQMDPKANAILGAEYVKQNLKSLSGVKDDINGTDVYMAHFLGAGGAKKFFSADPNAIGAQVMPEPASKNANIFYKGTTPRTVGDIYSLMNTKMQTKLQQHNVDASYFPSTSGLVAKTTSTTGLQVKAPTIGLDANNSVTPVAANTNTVSTTSNSQAVDTGVKSTTAKQNAPTVAPMISPMADIGGFNMQNMQQPLQNPKLDMTTAMGGIGSTLSKSLDVQNKMLQALETIVKMNGTSSPVQKPSQQDLPKVQTSEQEPQNSEGQQQNKEALRSFNVAANKMNVPVPMNRV